MFFSTNGEQILLSKYPPGYGVSMDAAQLCFKNNIDVTGVVHVGGHRGQEYNDYKKLTSGSILYVEAIPSLADTIND